MICWRDVVTSAKVIDKVFCNLMRPSRLHQPRLWCRVKLCQPLHWHILCDGCCLHDSQLGLTQTRRTWMACQLLIGRVQRYVTSQTSDPVMWNHNALNKTTALVLQTHCDVSLISRFSFRDTFRQPSLTSWGLLLPNRFLEINNLSGEVPAALLQKISPYIQVILVLCWRDCHFCFDFSRNLSTFTMLHRSGLYIMCCCLV